MSHHGHRSRLQLWLQGLSSHHLCSAQFASVLGKTPPSAQPLPLPCSTPSMSWEQGQLKHFAVLRAPA